MPDHADSSNFKGCRAVVIGGGIAGLLAAHVLSRHFQQVDILERDSYADEAVPRDGIPQARHVHILLEGGRRIMEQLFPGFTAEMLRCGATVVDSTRELATLTYHGWSPREPAGLRMITCSRSLIGWSIRRRLRECSGICFLQRHRVIGLTADPTRSTVTGVRCRHADVGGGAVHEHRADLVVDASGRFSRLPEWLRDLGYYTPPETVVDAGLGYATRVYERPSTFRASWKALVLLGRPPDERRGGVLLPIERDRWLVTLAGMGRDYPPQGETGFLEFARSLRSDALYEAVRGARPLSGIAGNRSTRNRLRPYHTMHQWPHRLIALGDAVCALNPIHAQGMSVAARGALTLRRVLRKTTDLKCRRSARRFQRELARANTWPWLMSAGDDMRWPTTEGPHPDLLTRVLHRYLDAVMAASVNDAEVHSAVSRVVHLLDHPFTLLHPRVAGRSIISALSAMGGDATATS